jgi:hypothetical protein
MGRKQRLVKARLERRLSDFDVAELLCFMAAWSPPRYPDDRERWRWQTWAEFLDDYEAIRVELRADFAHVTKPFFAERVRRFVERHGLEALEDLTCSEDLRQALEDDEGEPDTPTA